ncbi:hypothetical protein EON81_09930 [bacterium]|nr:MAG: hypothetical protein EON81_09930 [bacterium]
MKRTALLALVLASAGALAQTNTLRISRLATRADNASSIDVAVRAFAKRAALLTEQSRKKHWRSSAPFSLPVRVELIQNGRALKSPITRADGDLVLAFDSSGSRAFPSDTYYEWDNYRAFLQDVFAKAQPFLDGVYGRPIVGGTVRIANYDADISDRLATAGGVYVPNDGTGRREIRFPVYNSPDAAAINFIHTLLLAYQGDTPITIDAWQEGLARAATMQIARSLVNTGYLDATAVESVLTSSYDVGGEYDWNNQPALSGRRFIAPNLLEEPLPVGGSRGGLFLLRYRMAGAAFEKVLTQFPSFAAELNGKLKADPSLASNASGLVTAAGMITTGGVEGRPFADWYRHQEILDTVDEPGYHVHIQPTPITTGLSGSDYGVFNLEAALFQKDALGNETLKAGTAYPIFWEFSGSDFLRTLPGGTSQYDQIDFALGYGSIGPNFENDGSGPYRIAYDLSVSGVNQRIYLPIGAIATSSTSGAPNDLFGTVTGLTGTGATTVRVSNGADVLATIPVANGTFGTKVALSSRFSRAIPLKVEVLRGSTVLLTRFVNKGVTSPSPTSSFYGGLYLDLRIGEDSTQTVVLPKGASAFGLSIEPFQNEPRTALNVTSSLLFSRYDPLRAQWALYPDSQHLHQGFGQAVRLPAAKNVTVAGRKAVEPTSVALSPGWNLIAVPVDFDLSASAINVVTGTEFPYTYAEAQDQEILGRDAFLVNPSTNDPASGVPETFSYTGTSNFPTGRAIFVRCLRSEGATILFGATAPRSTRSSPPITNVWRARVVAYAPDNTNTLAYVGLSRSATRNFDPREDSALPPSRGGFQVAVGGGYRDVRRAGATEEYPVRLDGLVKGKTYSVVITQELGFSSRLSVFDPVLNRRTMITSSGRVTFTATDTSRTLTLRVEGVK